jgi:hypothetical protein
MCREWKKTEFPKENLEITRLGGRPRNKGQDEMREERRIVAGKSM